MNTSYDENSKIWKGVKLPYSYPSDYMFSDLIFEKLNEDPKRVVQICADDNSQLTCEDLKLSSIRVAQNLIKSGVKPNDVICMITKQSHTTTILITGIIFAGALVNPLEENLDESDIRAVCEKTKPRIIICDPHVIPKVINSLNGVDFVYRIYSTSSDSEKYLKSEDLLTVTGEEENFKPLKFEETSSEKILAILCTSGTTGAPKGMCLMNDYLLNSTAIQIYRGETRSACLSPLYWSSGFYPNISLAYSPHNVRIFTKELFSIEMVIKLVEEYKVTDFVFPPSQLATILDSEKFLSSKNESLHTIIAGGGIVANVLRDKFYSLFPDRNLTIAYGMTEIGISMTKPGESKIYGSVGSIIFPNTDVKIVDDEGRALDKGETGEICAKTNFNFQGYYNNPQATKDALDPDNFIKTGDIGYFNDEGMLVVIDRKKDIFKYRNYQINPSDIENLILQMDGVESVSVVALPDIYRGGLAVAAIIKKPNSSLTSDEVVNYVANQLPFFKHLHGGAYFLDEFPMTPNGKIRKRNLIEIISKIKEM